MKSGIVKVFVGMVALSFSLVAQATGEPLRLLFLGNSITKHGPKESIGWSGNWGMAASAEANDYVHLVAASVKDRTGVSPELRVRNIADFERGILTWDVAADTDFADDVAFAPNVVVIAIGENTPTPSGATDQATYRAQFKRLVSQFVGLNSVGKDKIVVRSSFWRDETKAAIMKSVATELGVLYVDASPLGDVSSNKATGLFADPGVANHPGDAGMRAIANLLIGALWPTDSPSENPTVSPSAKTSVRAHTPKGVARAAYAGQASFTDSLGGAWSLTDGSGNLLTVPVTKVCGTGTAVGVKSATTDQPHITENETDTGVATGTGAELNDDEIAMHPYDTASAVLCYTASNTGFCNIFVGARSLSVYNASYNDVTIQVYVNGGSIHSANHVRTVDYQVYPDFEKKDVFLRAGETVKVYVSPGNGGGTGSRHNCDWTAVRVRIKDTAVCDSIHEAWQAVHDEIAANGASRRPTFVDGKGCGWSFGWAYLTYTSARSLSRTMTVMDTLADKTVSPEEPALGWQAASPAKNPAYNLSMYQNLPRFLCYEGSANSTTFAGAPTSGGCIRPRELFTHPNSAVASVVRFTAPKDGVYLAYATFRDMANNTWNTQVKGWLYVDAGRLCAPQTTWDLATDLRLLAPYVYLQKGATVDFALAPSSARVIDSDATAFSFCVAELKDWKQEVLSVDITSGRAHTGSGRVGFGSSWDCLAVANGMTSAETTWLSARRADGTKDRKAAKFQLSRISGFAVETGDGFSNNGVVSASDDEAYEFSFSGLAADSEVRLYLYGKGSATFVVDGMPHTIDQSWFDETAPDYVVVETTADRDGVVKGVFRASGSTSATFSGAQVSADGLRKPGFGLYIR